jgi:hypothetical protein
MPDLELTPPHVHASGSRRTSARTRLIGRCLAYALGAAALILVFGLYVQPEMMVTLAEQLWACF